MEVVMSTAAYAPAHFFLDSIVPSKRQNAAFEQLGEVRRFLKSLAWFFLFVPDATMNMSKRIVSISVRVGVAALLACLALPSSAFAAPYHTNYLPGIIQAERFDLGGEGVAYHDTTPSNELS